MQGGNRAEVKGGRGSRCCGFSAASRDMVGNSIDRLPLFPESSQLTTTAGRCLALHPPAPPGVQELRRPHRARDRARADRRGRAERLRQVEPPRGAALGDGREPPERDARRRHGGRDLRRLRQPAGAQPRRGHADHRQPRPQGAGRRSTTPTSSRSCAASPATPARPTGSTGARRGRATSPMLFADASTGAQSPALVRQGQIAELINARPKARRRVLEEAAGISGLYQRRHEAELKLRATEANLARVADVIEALETQLASLARQARQAQRYREIAESLRRAEATAALAALARRRRRPGRGGRRAHRCDPGRRRRAGRGGRRGARPRRGRGGAAGAARRGRDRRRGACSG